MRRRTILAAVGTATLALAGCVSEDEQPPGENSSNGNDTDDNGNNTDDNGNDTDDNGNGTDDNGNSNGGNGDESATSGGNPAEQSVIEAFDGEPVRPECVKESETIEVGPDDDTREVETPATIPYPDGPATFDEAAVTEFVEEFERAYVNHDVLCDGVGSSTILNVGYDVQESERFDWYENVTVVYLLRAGAATWGIDENGYEWQADIAYSGVVYAVDETGVARAPFDDAPALEGNEVEDNAPDPLAVGDLVATFE